MADSGDNSHTNYNLPHEYVGTKAMDDIMQQVRLGRTVARLGGSLLISPGIFFSPDTQPQVLKSKRRVVIFPNVVVSNLQDATLAPSNPTVPASSATEAPIEVGSQDGSPQAPPPVRRRVRTRSQDKPSSSASDVLSVEPLNRAPPRAPRADEVAAHPGGPLPYVRTVTDQRELAEYLPRTKDPRITSTCLGPLRRHYDIPQEVSIRAAVGEEGPDMAFIPDLPGAVESGGYAGYTSVFWEALNYGLRFPVSDFVNEVLAAVDRAPGQIHPFSWLILTVFQIACQIAEVSPTLALFSKMYRVQHKSVGSSFMARDVNFLYTKDAGKVEPYRWYRHWMMVKGGFGDRVPLIWSFSPSSLQLPESKEVDADYQKLKECFPDPYPAEAWCDPDVLAKAGFTSRRVRYPTTPWSKSLISPLFIPSVSHIPDFSSSFFRDLAGREGQDGGED